MRQYLTQLPVYILTYLSAPHEIELTFSCASPVAWLDETDVNTSEWWNTWEVFQVRVVL